MASTNAVRMANAMDTSASNVAVAAFAYISDSGRIAHNAVEQTSIVCIRIQHENVASTLIYPSQSFLT